MYSQIKHSSVVSSLIFWALPIAAWFFTGSSCDLTLATEMHMKMYVEVSMDLDVTLQGQSVTLNHAS
jgi:hypothetical protein